MELRSQPPESPDGHMAATAKARSRPIKLLVLCAAALIGAVVLGTAGMIFNARERLLTNEERELQNIALVLAAQIDHIFEAAERVQIDMIERFRVLGISSSEDFERRMSSYDVHEMLRDKIVGLPHVGTFTLVNAEGRLFNFSRFWPIPDISVVDRDFYKAFQSDPTLISYVSKPIQNRATKTWVVQIARKVTGPNGDFIGLVTAAIELQSIERFFASVALGEGSGIALFHRDGAMLARYPHVDAFIGRPLPNGFAAGALGTADRAVGRRTGAIASEDLIIAAHRVARYPLVVGAIKNAAVALAGWHREALFLAGAGGFAALMIAVVAFLIVRQLLQGTRRYERELREQKLQLDVALDNISQGLCVFDGDARLVLCNRRYIEMYGLSRDIVRPGCTFRDIVNHRKDAGFVPGDPERYYSSILDTIGQGKTSIRSVATTDGRSIHMILHPMATGGWVATHEDVTERRRAESERDRNREFLDLVVENVPSAIFVKDVEQHRYILANRAGEKFWGIARSDLIGKTVYDFFPKDLADMVTAHDAQLARCGGELFFDEHTLATPGNGTRIVTTKKIAIPGADGAPKYLLGVIEDVTERRLAAERVAHLAHYDALTDLPNRVLFREQLELMLGRAGRGEHVAVLYLDLDHFKNVNDTLGHPLGDELLRSIAQRLLGCVGKDDVVARLGGDEFAIIQNAIAGAPEAIDLANRIHAAVRETHHLSGHLLVADASIGIAIAPENGTEPDELLKHADLAMYEAKSDGRATFRVFEPEMDGRMKARRNLESDLRKAVMGGELEVYYQPIVDLQHDRISGCEALLRWHHPVRGIIPPAEFIPVAEETGLIVAIGEWTLRRACADAASWPNDMTVSVNLSPVQFRKQGLALTITGALAAAGLRPDRLELEITETALMQNNASTLATLHQLRALGVRIAMDDFGTGYSSLSYLRSFPFNRIKIDRSFVRDLGEREEALVIVQAIAALARNLGMTTTAEGVETEQQLAIIRAAGCTQMQGYLFSPPRPLAELAALWAPQIRRVAGAA
jgi:diguanylate cyclase (GGDEF)-like protein/PAS domain S-box-containing protein